MFIGSLFSKTCLKRPVEHSAILLAGIKIPNGFQACVLSIFEWLLKTDFTVLQAIWSKIRLLPKEQSDQG